MLFHLYFAKGMYYTHINAFAFVLLYFAVYNVHPCFCAHYTWDYYTHYHTHGMSSLYPCIMSILIFASKIWAKKCTLYMAKYVYAYTRALACVCMCVYTHFQCHSNGNVAGEKALPHGAECSSPTVFSIASAWC